MARCYPTNGTRAQSGAPAGPVLELRSKGADRVGTPRSNLHRHHLGRGVSVAHPDSSELRPTRKETTVAAGCAVTKLTPPLGRCLRRECGAPRVRRLSQTGIRRGSPVDAPAPIIPPASVRCPEQGRRKRPPWTEPPPGRLATPLGEYPQPTPTAHMCRYVRVSNSVAT
jgi:hypothetical protein